MRILKHDAQRAAQVVLLNLVDVDAVVTDFAVLNIVEPVDKVGDGRLARAGRADERDFLPRRRVELDVMQHQLVIRIAEIHVIHDDIAFKLAVLRFARVLVRVFPRPQTGALPALGEAAVLLPLCVDEGYIAVVHLRLFIQQGKDALRTRQCHDDGVGLLRNLVDWLVEALVERQEGNQRADGQPEVAVRRQQTADDRAKHVAQVAHRHGQRHDGIGDSVRAVCALAQSVVQLLEPFKVFLLMAENLDDLLTIHHLLDIAVDLAQVGLLLNEEASRVLDALHGKHHRGRDHEQRDDEQRHIQNNHRNHDAHDGHDAGNQLGHRLGDHLAHGIDIVGVNAHDIAVRMGIEILNRQTLHLGEELDAQVLERALRNKNHQIIIQPAAKRAEDIDRRHAEDSFAHRTEIRIRLSEHRHDVVINQPL